MEPIGSTSSLVHVLKENAMNTDSRPAKRHWTSAHFSRNGTGGYDCKYCDTSIKAAKDNSPGNLINHLFHQHKDIYAKDCPEDKKRKTDADENKEEPINRDDFLKKLIRFLVSSDQPYSLVENEAFRDLIQYISKDRKVTEVPGRNLITARISDDYEQKKYEIAKKIQDSGSKVSLVIDCWKSANQISFQGVMVRFIDINWELQTFPIDLTELHGPHSGENLADSLLEVMNEMNLLDKIVSITTDNAANMGTFFHHFERKLGEMCIAFDVKDQRVRCLAHILNLSCKLLISVAEEHGVPVQKVKEGIQGIRNGSNRRDYFVRQCELLKMKLLLPSLDCCTRWNTTHDLIQRALEVQKPMQATVNGLEDLRKFSLEPAEWDSLKKLKDILDPFKKATNMISLEKYPNIASSTFIFQYMFQHCDAFIKKSRSKNKNSKAGQNEPEWVMLGMTKAKAKLEEFYGDTDGKSYVIGTVLHPSFKLEWYKSAKGWSTEWIEGCKKVVLDEWTSNYKPVLAPAPEAVPDSDDFFDSLYQDQMKGHIESDELTTYLSSMIIPRKEIKKIGVLNWWKNHQSDYPNLSKMARDYLSVGGSGVPAERFFSTGTDVLTENRQRLTGQHIKELMCLKYWYKILEPVEEKPKEQVS